MNDLSPAEVMARLSEIDRQLAELQGAWETAVVEHARLEREWKVRHATAFLATDKGNTVREREAAALLGATQADDLGARLGEVEDGLVKAKTAYQVLERRASIGQSILRALTQERFQSPQQPRWSEAA